MQCVVALGGVRCTDTQCPVSAQLDLGQETVRASQWHQCLHHPTNAYTFWSTPALRIFVPLPRSSQGAVGNDMEGCAAFQEYGSAASGGPADSAVLWQTPELHGAGP